jgi:acyl dehydratase
MLGVLALPEPWTVRARNLPEHADNRIHTDAGARAAGFPAALVAGVTTYAYLTHPIVAAWGLDWVANGGGEVRFDAPVFDHDEVTCTPVLNGDGVLGDAVVVDARCGDDDEPRATLRAVPLGGPAPVARDGTPLTSRRVQLGDRWGADYGERVGDDLDVYRRQGVVHPAVWPALANHVVGADLVRGPWIHLRSVVRHHALAPAESIADVHAVVVDRFHRRSGERAIVDVRIEVDGRPVASLEHEAIIALP